MKRFYVMSVIGVFLLSAVMALPVMAGDDALQDVYAHYVKAQRAGDMEGICKYINDGRAQQLRSLPEAEQKQKVEEMKKMSPSEYSVIKEKIQGDNALLTLSGKSTAFDGGSREHRGYIRFVKEGGKWKVREELWK